MDYVERHQELLKQKFETFKCTLQPVPPIPCDFEIGDQVTYTNDYGVEFEGLEVIGFAEEIDFYAGRYQRFVYLDTGIFGAYWFPHSPSELKAKFQGDKA